MADLGPLRFTVTLTPKDLARMNGEFCWRWSNLWSNLALTGAAVIVVFGTYIAISVSADVVGLPLPHLVIVVLATIVMFETIRIFKSMQLARPAKESNSIFEPTTYEISEDGVRMTAPSFETLLRWRAFKGTIVKTHAAYLDLGLNRAAVVPRSAFSSPAAFDEFVDRCRREIGRAPHG